MDLQTTARETAFLLGSILNQVSAIGRKVTAREARRAQPVLVNRQAASGELIVSDTILSPQDARALFWVVDYVFTDLVGTGANLVPAEAAYDESGAYNLGSLDDGSSYVWTLGTNEFSAAGTCGNGVETIGGGSWEMGQAGMIWARPGALYLTGEPLTLVTATVKAAPTLALSQRVQCPATGLWHNLGELYAGVTTAAIRSETGRLLYAETVAFPAAQLQFLCTGASVLANVGVIFRP